MEHRTGGRVDLTFAPATLRFVRIVAMYRELMSRSPHRWLPWLFATSLPSTMGYLAACCRSCARAVAVLVDPNEPRGELGDALDAAEHLVGVLHEADLATRLPLKDIVFEMVFFIRDVEQHTRATAALGDVAFALGRLHEAWIHARAIVFETADRTRTELREFRDGRGSVRRLEAQEAELQQAAKGMDSVAAWLGLVEFGPPGHLGATLEEHEESYRLAPIRNL